MAGSTADLIRGAVQTASSGGKVDSNTVDGSSPGSHSANVEIDSPDKYAEAQESRVEDFLTGDGDDAHTDSSEGNEAADSSAEATSKSPQKTSSAKEVITITDDKGRRRVEVDFNNREQMKKYVQMAHGSRKWQAERDQAIQSGRKIQAELQQSKENWGILDNVYKKGGIEGLVDLLEGRKGAHRDYEKKIAEKLDFLKRASPEEVDAYNSKQEAERNRRELAEIRQENEKFKGEIVKEREAAELRSLESKVHPTFDKYRFADKLGDANDEHMFDEMLWNSALKRLEPYEEQGLEISPELIDREFKAVASALRKRIGVQADKKASKFTEQKKREATENVQAKVMSGYKSGGAAKEARDLLNSGNTLGLLQGWSKYGSMFQKKK